MTVFRHSTKRVTTAAATLGIAAAGVLLTPVAANAAALDGNCQASEVCLYQNQFYGGGMADFVYNDANYADNNFVNSGTGLNDRVSSLKNRDANCDLFLYSAANWSGTMVSFERGEDYFYVSPLINDAASSHKWSCS